MLILESTLASIFELYCLWT